MRQQQISLLRDLQSFGSDSFEPVRKVVRKTSTLKKSQTVQEAMLKAGLDPQKLRPFTGKPPVMREQGTTVGQKVLVKGKQAIQADPGVNAEPPEHPGIRVAKAISEMRAHARGKDINGPVTPGQLEACRLLVRTGRMEPWEVDDVERALNDRRALPSHILRKLGSGNA
jgi:hypothetical protein